MPLPAGPVGNGPNARLPKAARLTGRSPVRHLFARGKSFRHEGLRFIYLANGLAPTARGPVQVLLSAPKRQHRKATRRNRLKRLLREAYRHERAAWLPSLPPNTRLALAIVHERPDELPLPQLRAAMAIGLQRVARQLAGPPSGPLAGSAG